jgi:tryptophan synthase, alpha subunit
MNRIDKTFRDLAAANRKALIAYLTAGDPDFDASLSILRAAAASGADVLELGVPFSDPTCDGPVIQAASERALKSGMTLSKTFQLASLLRETTQTPIILFSYYNPLFKYGLARAAASARAAGIDGILVVDLPPEESAPLATALAPATPAEPPIHLIRLAAPTTRPERLEKLTRDAGGFLYLISRAGVTGTGGIDYAEVSRHAQQVKSRCASLPVCIGFGVSSFADAHALAPMSDGVIVGSALVRLIAEASATAADSANSADTAALAERVAAKIRELREGLDSAE